MRSVSSILGACCLLWSLAATAEAQDQIHWQPDLESAQRLAAQHKKLVLIHFWAPWCKPCRQLEQSVFAQPDVGRSLDANFVMVKLNADDSPATTRMYYVSSLPTDVIITPDGRLVASLPSPQTAQQYVAQMNQAADGHRRLGAGGTTAGANPMGQTANPYSAAAATAGQQSVAEQQPAIGQPAANQQAINQQAVNQQVVSQAAAGQPMVGRPVVDQSVIGQPVVDQSVVGSPPMGAAQPPQGAYAAQPQAPGQGPAGADAAPPSSLAGVLPPSNLPAGAPQLGLDGCCPVTLVEQKRWARGDAQWGAIHRGRTYLFASSEAQRRFLANPDAYSPVIEGNDPVLALDNRQLVPGSRMLGVFFEKRVYLFSSEETLRRFEQNPKRYAAEIVQAMR
jgi:YHS domain-containing protein/thiol-disulfide isomerase/thioredoxin